MSLRVEQEGRAAAVRREGVGTRAAARAEVNFERLRAPFSLRCGALLIDYILLAGVMAFATLLARLFGDMRRGSTFVLTAGYVAVASVAFLNFVLIAALSGRTLGKWMAGLRIERRDGEPLSIVRALVRHLLGYALTALTLGLGFLLSAFDSKGRALHDLIAGTVVVRSRGSRSAPR
ncbi:MAG TPA: RDD family protein [Pyrinomonadaceae bacterium]|jgi:uncharacterized RDD family membrane protein YckC|nr:RDD family protein [Pyrinomonadaceae bacterium]